MWELAKRFSHGRVSVRRSSMLAITGLMTLFVAAIVTTTPAYADDATRTGTSVTYKDITLTPFDPAKDLPPALASQNPKPTGYRYIDTSGKKAHFILTTDDPSKATTGSYVVYDFIPPANFSNMSPPVDITFIAENADGVVTTSQCNDTSLTGIGWWICPTANFIAISMDKIYGIISDFLVVRTVTANMESPLFQLWAVIRDIANICFVIAILIIVYSQLTSIGISNYGLKKTLPRLIIAAILVNVSFWLCTIAVDASNILGYSIHGMFTGLIDRFSIGSNYNGNASIPTWEQVTLVALSGTGIAVGGYTILAATVSGSLPLLLPFLIGGVLAVLVALIVLAARQALITILIIISPLAFVAYVLPNTEKWFTKWRETLTTLLLLFPIFSVVFSGAQLAGIAIIQSAGGNLFTIILGLATQVAPIVITPLLVKFSGGLIGKVAGLMNNPNKGLLDRTRKWAEGASQERRNKILADQNRMSHLNQFNPLTRASKAINKRRRFVDGRRKAYEAAADNWFDDTDRGRQVKTMTRDFGNDKKDGENRYMGTADGRRTELRSRHLDVNKQEVENDLLRSSGGKYVTYRQGMAEVDKTRVHNEFEQHSFGHQLDTAKREVERQKQHIAADHDQSWHFRNLNDAGSQEREMRLRIATDKAAQGKLQVDTMYNELKFGEAKSLTKVEASVAANLAQTAYATAEGTALTTIRSGNATNELKSKINNAVLTNGAVYQVDASGDKVIVNGKPVVVDNRMIDGKTLQEYATGVGTREVTLANAVSEERADWGKQSKAAGELIEHFKLNSNDSQKLATGGKGTIVKVTDDNGNEFEFSADDEFAKEAAIVKQFQEGSASQKEQIINESGREIEERDANGNVIGTRQGHNYAHRSTIKNEAKRSSISGLLPFINDITYDEIGKGNYSGTDSKMMHNLRQIFDGRVKSNNLVGAADGALTSLIRAGELVDSTTPAEAAEYQKYKSMVLDLYRDIYKDSPADYQRIVSNFDNKVRENLGNTLGNFKQILENTTLSGATSIVSKEVMKEALRRHGVSWKDR